MASVVESAFDRDWLLKTYRALRSQLRLFRYWLAGRANRGYCPICEKPVTFVRHGEWLRDEYRCQSCRSTPRFRATILTLQRLFPDWRSLSIHESSPGSPSSEKLARECPGYSSSQYFPGIRPGSLHQGTMCQDLHALSFADGTFDMIVTQDVFEHIPDPSRGFAEVARVLKPGGAHVFTVPYYAGKQTFVRSRLKDDGAMVHFAPQEFHSNPVDRNGSLVTTEWGDDLADFIFEASGMTTSIYHYHDPTHGLLGEFLYIFVSRKRRLDGQAFIARDTATPGGRVDS